MGVSLSGDILMLGTVHGIGPVCICLSANFKILQYFWNDEATLFKFGRVHAGVKIFY